jgi:hypothetical protein
MQGSVFNELNIIDIINELNIIEFIEHSCTWLYTV